MKVERGSTLFREFTLEPSLGRLHGNDAAAADDADDDDDDNEDDVTLPTSDGKCTSGHYL